MINPFERPPIPDKLAYDALRGNWLYPQMTGGIAAITGARAIQMCLDGELDMRVLARSRASTEQLERLAQSAIKAHEKFNIPATYKEKPDRSIRYEFGPKKLKEIAHGTWLPRSMNVISDYADEVLPRERWCLRRRHTVGNAAYLLERQRAETFRPEVITLGAMWQVASDTVRNHPSSKELAATHKAGLQDLSEGRASQREISRLVTVTTNQLFGLVSEQVEDALPNIQQSTGVEVSIPQARSTMFGLIVRQL